MYVCVLAVVCVTRWCTSRPFFGHKLRKKIARTGVLVAAEFELLCERREEACTIICGYGARDLCRLGWSAQVGRVHPPTTQIARKGVQVAHEVGGEKHRQDTRRREGGVGLLVVVRGLGLGALAKSCGATSVVGTTTVCDSAVGKTNTAVSARGTTEGGRSNLRGERRGRSVADRRRGSVDHRAGWVGRPRQRDGSGGRDRGGNARLRGHTGIRGCRRRRGYCRRWGRHWRGNVVGRDRDRNGIRPCGRWHDGP